MYIYIYIYMYIYIYIYIYIYNYMKKQKTSTEKLLRKMHNERDSLSSWQKIILDCLACP